ncbi:membrane-binding protein [Methanolobus psychrotolerans]|uniref:membrane-binding protein n=1 Tax=Methanolobus psychrotolerans TaxID=1874706 RepID=UPI000B91CBD0|nr:membrane-binding protein [Methanolobus psychrotolerans]
MKLKMLITIMLLIAVAASGCGDKDSTTYETDDGQTVEVTTTNEDDWCSVGSSWTSTTSTGEVVSMVITGSEVIDGVRMCKAEFKSTNPEDDVSRIEYMWSEDGETFSWKYYDTDENLVSEMSLKDGKMTIMDEEGNVQTIEYNQ